MKNLQTVNVIAMIIGLVGIGFGIYGLIAGSEFQNYFSNLFIGITLFGTAYINQQSKKEK